MVAAEELAGQIGQTTEACEALGVARSTLYRRRQVTPEPKRRPRPHRALDETEREEVLGALHCERFVDKAPRPGVGHASGRGNLPLLDSHDVSDFGGARRGPRAPEPTVPSELHEAGAAGRSAQPGLVVGYYEASWPRQVDLLLPLRHPRHLLPLMWLAGCWLTEKVRRSRNASSPRAVASRTLNPTSSPFTRTVAAR